MARTKVSSMSLVIVLRMPVRKDHVSTLKIQQGDGFGIFFLDLLSLDALDTSGHLVLCVGNKAASIIDSAESSFLSPCHL